MGKGTKWRVTYPNNSKKKSVYSTIADTAKAAWAITRRPFLSDNGHKMMQHSLYPISIRKVEEEYKGLAHTIRDVHLQEAKRKGFDIGKHFAKLGLIATASHATPQVIVTKYPDQVGEELDRLQANKTILSRPRISRLRNREAASELEEGLMDPKPCPCGSGKSSWWESDAKGYPLARVCENCFERKMKKYRPEVLTNPSYKHSEDAEPQDGDLAPWERDLYEEHYLFERRKGPTKASTREKQRVGAKRAAMMKSVKPRNPRKRKNGLSTIGEAISSGTPPNQPISKYVPDKQSGGAIMRVFQRAGRRRAIDLTADNVRIPAKSKGWRPFVFWNGTTFNN